MSGSLPLRWGLGHSVEQQVPPCREMELNQMSGSPDMIFCLTMIVLFSFPIFKLTLGYPVLSPLHARPAFDS